MIAARLLSETVDDIFGDPKGAVVCLVPMLAAYLSLVAAVYFLSSGTMPETMDEQEAISQVLDVALVVIVLLPVLVVAWSWTAVSWHRKVVMQEHSGTFVPLWPGLGTVLGYIGRTILVFILAVLASIPILLVASLIAPNSTTLTEDGTAGSYTLDGGLPVDTSPVGIVVWLLVTGLVNGIFLRLAMILPAGAVGKALGISEVWRRTKGHFVLLFLPLGILIAVVPFVFTWITSLISFGGVLDFIAFGVVTLLGIGILTRLYLMFVMQPADPSQSAVPS